ncbi:hypothetical protein GCM10017600_05790 [Streptosporangium carneum]|uniref:Uncharacterized protein n=1 Tax=Streptosporangium carneum TaxID=47481 RepID=A0A9W6HXG1_9ACTN|nr:hypothetical protein GCM10017600_05790 [Streptosporangium carneum]
MGRISLVTMAKMPSMSEVTVSQLTKGERDWARVVDIVPVQAGASGLRTQPSSGEAAGTGMFRTRPSP